jgi:hypothetical protein
MNLKKSLPLFVTLFILVLYTIISGYRIQHNPQRLEILFPGHANNREHNTERPADIFTAGYFMSVTKIFTSIHFEPGNSQV